MWSVLQRCNGPPEFGPCLGHYPLSATCWGSLHVSYVSKSRDAAPRLPNFASSNSFSVGLAFDRERWFYKRCSKQANASATVSTIRALAGLSKLMKDRFEGGESGTWFINKCTDSAALHAPFEGERSARCAVVDCCVLYLFRCSDIFNKQLISQTVTNSNFVAYADIQRRRIPNNSTSLGYRCSKDFTFTVLRPHWWFQD